MLPKLLLLILLAALWQITDSNSGEQIRSARQRIDQSFQQHDAKQLRSWFTSDCHFTSAATHVEGADRLEQSHASLFTRRPDVVFLHHVNRVAVNENWNVASEEGDWIERWTEKDGVTELRGTYLAMWKREAGRWLEHSEIIVPESCSGSSYCKQ